MTGRDALLLAVQGLVSLVRDEYPNAWSLKEIAEAGPSAVTDVHVAAIAALESFGGEFLARWFDEVLPEVSEVDVAEQVDSSRGEGCA